MIQKVVKSLLNPQNLKMVLVVRTDLKLSKGKIASQCSHASILCYEKIRSANLDKLKSWIKYGQPKIVLKVETLEELVKLFDKAQELGVVAEFVRDAGRTQTISGTITVLGLGPDEGDTLDSITNGLKLL